MLEGVGVWAKRFFCWLYKGDNMHCPVLIYSVLFSSVGKSIVGWLAQSVGGWVVLCMYVVSPFLLLSRGWVADGLLRFHKCCSVHPNWIISPGKLYNALYLSMVGTVYRGSLPARLLGPCRVAGDSVSNVCEICWKMGSTRNGYEVAVQEDGEAFYQENGISDGWKMDSEVR